MKLDISMGMININRISFYSLLNDKARDLLYAEQGLKKSSSLSMRYLCSKGESNLPKSVSPKTGHLH